ncbi:hypothetical protein NHQ30_003870 [Ciborinia camelliae]|nr:hypothetical protein NHQ30_003870 [Ciborinia camelliae]
MRSKIEQELSKLSLADMLQDLHRITKMILGLTSSEWQAVIRDQEGYMLPGLKPQYVGATDVRLSEKEAFGEYLKQALGMLKRSLQFFSSLREKSVSFKSTDDLLGDFKFLEAKVMAQMEYNNSSIPIITGMLAVEESRLALEESRKAIRQANDVKALTVLATVYIPLSFVAGVFGMNVAELNNGVDVQIWVYFAISIPVTIASMALVWKWEWAVKERYGFSIQIWQEKIHSEENCFRSSFFYGQYYCGNRETKKH